MISPGPTKTYHEDTYSSISPTLAHLSTAGKSAFITGGGGGGIGAAMATSFARSGISHLGLFGRKESTLLETKQSIQAISTTTTVHIFVGDLTDSPSIHKAISDFAAAVPGGKIDILVANAGYLADLSSVEAAEPKEWWRCFEINVLGNLNLLQAFIPFAATEKEKGDGKAAAIIHISTAVVHTPYLPGYSAYRASKAGATKLFENFAGDHPEFFILQVHPGLILSTSMSDKFRDTMQGVQGDTETLSGDFVNWAVSPEAKFLNGRFIWANWDVDELKAMAPKLANDPTLFTIGLHGWPGN